MEIAKEAIEIRGNNLEFFCDDIKYNEEIIKLAVDNFYFNSACDIFYILSTNE